jgi:gas vesicle protein
MSERGGGGGGFGPFLFGMVLGAVAGFLFAPTDSGERTRRKVTRSLRDLKELAGEKVDEVRGLLQEAAATGAESSEDAEQDEDDDEPETTREQLRRRLDATRRRRRARPPVPPIPEEEDEPLA